MTLPSPLPSPGPELDALVAERVMGWRREMGRVFPQNMDGYRFYLFYEKGYGQRVVGGRAEYPENVGFCPSISGDDAMQVLGRMSERGFEFHASVENSGRYCWVQFNSLRPCGECTDRSGEATAESLPIAICHAALRAVGERT